MSSAWGYCYFREAPGAAPGLALFGSAALMVAGAALLALAA